MIINKIKCLSPSYRLKLNLQQESLHIQERIDALDRKTEYLFWLSKQLPGEKLSETKARVFLELPKAEGALRAVQQGNAYILQRLRQICQEHYLSLFLIGGTRLGAVRHHGFIPWDDDIDVGIFRDDYLQLQKILKDDPELVMQSYYSPQYVSRLIKVKFRESDTFWVDIWVMEKVGCEMKIEEAWNRVSQMSDVYIHHQMEIIKKYYDITQDLARPVVDSRIDNEVFSFEEKLRTENQEWYGADNGDFVCLDFFYSTGDRKNTGILPVDWYFPIKKNVMLFENVLYDSINRDVDCVNEQYGDIWHFPPDINQCHSKEVGIVSQQDLELLKKLNLQ